MQFLIDLLLFIICLSVLIVVHELGHLSMAKVFNVYCFEFSVGFGPQLFRKKRKNGETYIALRCIPFGGYVSMYGESNGENPEKQQELPDGITEIPPERSLANIKKWKKSIILVAGVTLNAVLALLIFFVSNGPWFTQQTLSLYQINVAENSAAAEAGVYLGNEDDPLLSDMYYFVDSTSDEELTKTLKTKQYKVLSFDSEIVFKDNTTQKVAALFVDDTNYWSFKNRSLDAHLHLYPFTAEDEIDFDNIITPSLENLDVVNLKLTTLSLSYVEVEGKQKIYADTDNPNIYTIELDIQFDGTNYSLEETGISSLLYQYRHSFGEALGETFKDFGESSVLIVKALSTLFVNIDQVGGPVAIFTTSSKMLSEFGVTQFLDLWAMISVNLAIFNLIPFPGLDGWQLLIIGIEAVTKKKVPEKAQQIVSFVGMCLLFAFMAFILVKDIFMLF